MPKTCPVCSTTYPDTDAFCPKDGTTLRTDESANTLVGSVIADRYLVSKLLGEGGMGQVYLAGHVRLPQQAAIKVLHSSMVKDPGAVARFNREAANAARIEHERVARVFDFGETSNGLVYLAMEFVPGRTLREVLDDAGRLPPSRAANIVYQVAEGLDAAHRISIVHRDLKPDNILVITDEQGTDRCKVVDFGIAKAFDDSDNRKTQLTQAGAIIGTPEFMSPEQVLGEQLDARSDVYALAVVAYHLLTGTLPFAASTPERSLTARLISDPLPLRESAPDVAWPDALQAALDRAMSREPETRTASALEFADELVAATEAWTGAVVLRGRTPMSTAALASPRTVSGSVPSVAASAPASAPAAPPPSVGATAPPPVSSGVYNAPAPARSRTPMFVGVAVVLAAAAIGAYVMRGGDGGGNPAGEMAQSTEVNPPAAPSTDDATSERTAPANTAPPAQPQLAGRDGNRSDAGSMSPAAPEPAPAGAAPNAGAGSTTATVSVPEASGVGAAQREFDAVKATLLSGEEQDARAAIPRLNNLLGRFTSAADSAWVYIYLTQSYAMAGDPVRACTSLKAAGRHSKSENQARMVVELRGSELFKDCLL